MNSRSATRAPACAAIAMPSPVAIDGFVVSRNTWPAPPVASSVRATAMRAAVAIAADVARAAACAVGDDQLGRTGVLQHADARVRAHARPEQPADLAAGRIARVQDAPDAVRRLARRAPASRRSRDRTRRPTTSSSTTYSDLRGRARRPQRDRRGRRRPRSCPAHAAPANRRDRAPRQCRPAHSRCCFRAGSALVRMMTSPDFGERHRGAQTGDAAADDEEISAHIHFGMLSGSILAPSR